MDEDSISKIAKEYANGCQFSRGNVLARLAIEHAFVSGARHFGILSDVPAERAPSAENLVSFPPFSWRIVKNAIPMVPDTCLELTFQNQDEAVSALSQLQKLRRTPVKAVAVDTNEEGETTP